MNLELIQRFLCATVTVILLLNTVFAKQTNLTATSTKQTSLKYIFQYMNINENNTIVITADLPDTLVAFYVWTSKSINETLCQNGGNKVYSGGFPGAAYYVGTFCGGLKGETFVGSHNSMVIILDNVALSPTERLSVTYFTQKDCGEAATASRSPRYIRSPGYPNGGISAKFSTCAWLPHANNGERVRMTLKYAQESYTPDCHRSNVTIMDGVNLLVYRRTIGRWCGGPQSSYISWENMARILAKGQEYLQSGFEIEFVAVPGDKCEHKLSATSGIITTPGYPSGHTDLLECRWAILAAGKKNIRVTVLDSDMDFSLNCSRDNVKIYPNSQALDGEIEEWCGTDKPSYEFYNSVVLLVFKAGSDYNRPHRGIKFRYEISVEPRCGGNLTAAASSQSFTSPGYPNPFRGYQQCMWLIKASDPLKVVLMTVQTSDLYDSYVCDNERTDVYDGTTVSSERRVGSWCGRWTPYFRSSGPYMLVVFTAHRRNTKRKGFRASFVEEMCGAKKKTMSYPLWITSPGYPANYDSGYNCFWNLTASWGAIAVRFTDLDIRCPEDSITIYDGGTNLNNHWKVCGTGNYSYLSTTLSLHIHFKSQTNHGRGFNLTYSGYYKDVEGCGRYEKSIYPNKTQSVWHSPGYPGNYFDKMHCRWVFASFTRIKLEIQVKDIRKIGRTCGGDFIRVYDGRDNKSGLLRKICDGYTVVESSGSKLFVEFITDDSNTGSGFSIYYQGVGEKIVTEAPSGNSGSKNKSKGGSFNPWILVGGLIPTIVVVVIIVGIIIYVKCRHSSGSSRSTRNRYMADNSPPVPEYLPGDSNSEELQSINRRAPSAPSAPSAPPRYDNQQTDPYAPPPSYFEIDQFPKEVKNDDDPPVLAPPPSYTDAIRGGMIQNESQLTGASPDTAFSFV